jgi:hypothetical protein
MEQDKKWYETIGGVISIISGLTVFAIIVYLIFAPSLPASTNLMLTLIGIYASAQVSYILGKKGSFGEAQERIKGEANKALRRIIGVRQSALRLRENVDRITSTVSANDREIGGAELVLEYFGGIYRQLSDLLENVNSSIEDWRDIVPEQVKGLREAEAKQYELFEKKLLDLEGVRADYESRIHEGDEKLKAIVEEEVRKKTLEIEAKYRAELARLKISTPLYSLPTGVSSFETTLSGVSAGSEAESARSWGVLEPTVRISSSGSSSPSSRSSSSRSSSASSSGSKMGEDETD